MIHPAKPADKQIKKYWGTKPGDILIFHDGTTMVRPKTCILDVLEPVLDRLLDRGYKPVTISKLLSGS
jgi:hypothetical protein